MVTLPFTRIPTPNIPTIVPFKRILYKIVGLTFTSPNWPTDPRGVAKRLTPRQPDHPASSFYYPDRETLPPFASFEFLKVLSPFTLHSYRKAGTHTRTPKLTVLLAHFLLDFIAYSTLFTFQSSSHKFFLNLLFATGTDYIALKLITHHGKNIFIQEESNRVCV